MVIFQHRVLCVVFFMLHNCTVQFPDLSILVSRYYKNIRSSHWCPNLSALGRQFYEQRRAITRIYEAARVSEYNKAVSEFRGAFAPAIVKFKITSEANEINTMLREELIPQGIAIERFRPFVNLVAQ